MKVSKTIKLFIGGQFPRSESGRTYEFKAQDFTARVCQASRKDFRNAVDAAKKGLSGWSGRTAFNRSQILYRMAEMLEGKKLEFTELFKQSFNLSESEAEKSVDKGIDAFVYFAGFCDKYQQLSGSVNNINGPYHNFTTPDHVGVVAYVDSDEFNFERLCASLASIIAGGNSVVALLGTGCPAVLAPLAEVFATSDLPGGVINLLTGSVDELHEHIGSHMEVRSVNYQNENLEALKAIKLMGATNMKRVIYKHREEPLCLEAILDHVEFKSVWHPIGI